MSKGTFPLRTSKINVEGATKAATNGTINKETDMPTFIGDIDVSSQVNITKKVPLQKFFTTFTINFTLQLIINLSKVSL